MTSTLPFGPSIRYFKLADAERIEAIFEENEWIVLRATLRERFQRYVVARLHWIGAYLALAFGAFVAVIDQVSLLFGFHNNKSQALVGWFFVCLSSGC